MIIRKTLSISEIKDKIKEVKNQEDLESFKNYLMSDSIEDILCNSCGNSCKTNFNYEGLIEAVVSGGYSSSFVGDETSLKFSICEDCLKSIINNFKIPPAKRDDSSEFSDFVQPEVSQNKTHSLSIIKK